jgi:hypothetical protein
VINPKSILLVTACALAAFSNFALGDADDFAVPKHAQDPNQAVEKKDIDNAGLLTYPMERSSFTLLNPKMRWTDVGLVRALDVLVSTKFGRHHYAQVLPKIRRQKVVLITLNFSALPNAKYELPERTCVRTKRDRGIWRIYLNSECDLGKFVPDLGAAFERVNYLENKTLSDSVKRFAGFRLIATRRLVVSQLAYEIPELASYYNVHGQEPRRLEEAMGIYFLNRFAIGDLCELEIISRTLIEKKSSK